MMSQYRIAFLSLLTALLLMGSNAWAGGSLSVFPNVSVGADDTVSVNGCWHTWPSTVKLSWSGSACPAGSVQRLAILCGGIEINQDVAMTAPGTCNFVLDNVSCADWFCGGNQSYSLTVIKAQTITVSGEPATASFGSIFYPSAISTSGLPVSISASGGCSGSGVSTDASTVAITMIPGRFDACKLHYHVNANAIYAAKSKTTFINQASYDGLYSSIKLNWKKIGDSNCGVLPEGLSACALTEDKSKLWLGKYRSGDNWGVGLVWGGSNHMFGNTDDPQDIWSLKKLDDGAYQIASSKHRSCLVAQNDLTYTYLARTTCNAADPNQHWLITQEDITGSSGGVTLLSPRGYARHVPAWESQEIYVGTRGVWPFDDHTWRSIFFIGGNYMSLPNHVRFEFNSTALTCQAPTIGIKVCASAPGNVGDTNVACTPYTANPVTLTPNSDKGTWAPTSVTTSGGVGSAVLTTGATGNTTFSFSYSSPSFLLTNPALECYDIATNKVVDCAAAQIRFDSCNFDAVESGSSSKFGDHLFTKLAGKAFTFDVLVGSSEQLATTYSSAAVNVQLYNATSGAVVQDIGTYAFPAGTGRLTIPASSWIMASTAIANARIRMRDASVSATTCDAANVCSLSNDRFTVRPQLFTLASNQTTALRAGSGTFALTATGVAGYSGTPMLDSSKLSGLRADGATLATFTGSLGATFPAADATTGIATIASETYSEAGRFQLDVGGVNDKQFADASADIANSDCTKDFSNTLTNGKYGCYIQNTSALVSPGRFFPDHFTVTATPACNPAAAGGRFTYSGQPFAAFSVTAMNGLAMPTTTRNYNGTDGLSNAVFLDVNPSNVGGFPAVVTPHALTISQASFVTGVASPGNNAFTFATPATAPTSLTFSAVENGGDGVASTVNPTVAIWSGRVRMLPVSGSNLLDLPVTMRLERYESAALQWQPNAADQCTSVTIGPLIYSSLPAGATCVLDTGNPGASGQGCSVPPVVPAARQFNPTPGVATLPATPSSSFNLWLRAPGIANSGTVSVTPAVPAWLGAPNVIVTFGNAKPTPVIYRRENY